MNICACRTTALEVFLRELAGLHPSPTVRLRRSAHIHLKSSFQGGQSGRTLYTQSTATSSYVPKLPVYAYNGRQAPRNKAQAATKPQDDESRSISALKRAGRTPAEEAARAEKRMAKKIERVKANVFPRNKQRIRTLTQLFDITPTTKTRLQHRYHREKVARARAQRAAAKKGSGDDSAALDIEDELSVLVQQPSRTAETEMAGQSKTVPVRTDKKKARTRDVTSKPRSKTKGATPSSIQAEAAPPLRVDATPSLSEDQAAATDVQPLLKNHSDDTGRQDTTQDSLPESIEASDEEDVEIQSLLRDIEAGKLPEPLEIAEQVISSQNSDAKAGSAREASAATTAKPSAKPNNASTTKSKDKDDESATEVKFEDRRPLWAIRKEARRDLYGSEGWQPRKKLSPDSLNGVRALHESNPELYTPPLLAQHLGVSTEAIRRILKSKWQPKEGEIKDRRDRWTARGEKKKQAAAERRDRTRQARVVRDHDLRKDFRAAFGEDGRTRFRRRDRPNDR